jgi:hypothetical protein
MAVSKARSVADHPDRIGLKLINVMLQPRAIGASACVLLTITLALGGIFEVRAQTTEMTSRTAIPEMLDRSNLKPGSINPEGRISGENRGPSKWLLASESTVLEGTVTTVVDAAHLVVAGRQIRLIGVDPGPSDALAPFEKWLRARADLKCEPSPSTGRYRCVTLNGVDVAEAALLNGAAQVSDDAAPIYREREDEARQARRGLWAKQ